MKYLKLSPEYETSPLWISFNGRIFDNLDIEATAFDAVLKKRIADWAKNFDSTLNQEYPRDSGFSTPQQEKDFEFDALGIWKTIIQDYSDNYDKIILKSYSLAALYEDVSRYENDIKEKFRDKKRIN